MVMKMTFRIHRVLTEEEKRKEKRNEKIGFVILIVFGLFILFGVTFGVVMYNIEKQRFLDGPANFNGTVESVEYDQGHFGAPDYTSVKMEDGREIIFKGYEADRFEVGKYHEIWAQMGADYYNLMRVVIHD